MAFSSISDLWNKWNIRGIIMVSLLLQIFLILCAPLRKKIGNPRIIFPLWLAYLMADWVVAFGIGLISHSQGNLSARTAEVDGALQAFWASFMLLHLGGPDTITAFSLEDSSLWRRHLLNLIFQVGSAIYVFVQIFPSDKSLVIPTMLVFFAGVIKSAERTIALNLSSFLGLREWVLKSPGLILCPNFESVNELKVLGCEYSHAGEAKLSESVMVKHAYNFFKIFKVSLIDFPYSSGERLVSHKYFCNVSAMDALRVISVELHFMYELLHTKVLAIHSKWSYIFRIIAFIEIVMAFVLFNRFKKHQLPKLDVEITYVLLFGGIALDVITLFILVFSDWTIAEIMDYKTRSSKPSSFLNKFTTAMDDLGKPRFATCKAKPNVDATYAVLDTPIIFRRWSESISACNVFSVVLKESPRKMFERDQCWSIIAFSNICSLPFHMVEKIISCFHQIREMVIGRSWSNLTTLPRYVSTNPFINKLWIFIFEEVRRKSKDVHKPTEARKIFEARGDLFLQGRPGGIDCGNLLEHVTKANYDTSVMVWHIATEIWYNKEKHTKRNDEREFSKILSDYLLYLLLNHPNVMSAVMGFAQLTLGVMLEELEDDYIKDAKDVEGLCKTLYEDYPIEDCGTGEPLGPGIELARKMESFKERKWEVMSGVWVEMLSYAAGHIKGEAHVQVLSKGGELLAFVWLLMAHFGCLHKPEWSTYEDTIFAAQLETEVDHDTGNQEEDDISVETQLD